MRVSSDSSMQVATKELVKQVNILSKQISKGKYPGQELVNDSIVLCFLAVVGMIAQHMLGNYSEDEEGSEEGDGCKTLEDSEEDGASEEDEDSEADEDSEEDEDSEADEDSEVDEVEDDEHQEFLPEIYRQPAPPPSDAASPHSTPEPAEVSLEDVIKSAPSPYLRSALKLMCSKSAYVKEKEPFQGGIKRAIRFAVGFICSKDAYAKELASHRLRASIGNAKSQKRKRYETCATCGDEFDTFSNGRRACVYQIGEILIPLSELLIPM